MDATSPEFPSDNSGDALRRLQRNGDTLKKSRDIDFTVVFPTQVAASKFAKVFAERNYKTSVEESGCKPDLPWDVVVSRNMIPTHAEITEFEDELQDLADGFGGLNDGWGCFSQNYKAH